MPRVGPPAVRASPESASRGAASSAGSASPVSTPAAAPRRSGRLALFDLAGLALLGAGLPILGSGQLLRLGSTDFSEYACCVSTQVVRTEDAAPEDIAAASDVFKLLADPTRLRIVWALLHGEHAVTELADHVGAQVPAVSQHLAKLRAARVVRSRRDGNRVFYEAENAHVLRIVEEALLFADHVVRPAPEHHAIPTLELRAPR